MAMSAFSEQLDEHFSMELLDVYDPDNSRDMGQIIIRAYIINARAIRDCRSLVASDPYFQRLDRQSAARFKIITRARQNLTEVAGLLGPTVLTATPLEVDSPQLGSGSASVAGPATGIPRVNARNPRIRMAPGGLLSSDAIHHVRLYDRLPPPKLSEPGRYHDVRVVDDSLEPLVHIEVGQRV